MDQVRGLPVAFDVVRLAYTGPAFHTPYFPPTCGNSMNIDSSSNRISRVCAILLPVAACWQPLRRPQPLPLRRHLLQPQRATRRS